jgi:hypothetical protein
MGLNILIRDPPRTNQKLQPAWALRASTRFEMSQKITFSNNPHEMPGRINDWYAADSILEHQSRRIRQ